MAGPQQRVNDDESRSKHATTISEHCLDDLLARSKVTVRKEEKSWPWHSYVSRRRTMWLIVV